MSNCSSFINAEFYDIHSLKNQDPDTLVHTD